MHHVAQRAKLMDLHRIRIYATGEVSRAGGWKSSSLYDINKGSSGLTIREYQGNRKKQDCCFGHIILVGKGVFCMCMLQCCCVRFVDSGVETATGS